MKLGALIRVASSRSAKMYVTHNNGCFTSIKNISTAIAKTLFMRKPFINFVYQSTFK
jgi:hypothetical protein